MAVIEMKNDDIQEQSVYGKEGTKGRVKAVEMMLLDRDENRENIHHVSY